MKNRSQIDEAIKRLEHEIKELKELKTAIEADPLIELENEVSRMRFLNQYSSREIVDFVLKWKP